MATAQLGRNFKAVTIDGHKEIRRKMMRLKFEVADKLMRIAMRKGALKIKRAVRAAAPVGTPPYTYEGGQLVVNPYEHPYRGRPKPAPGNLKRAIVVKGKKDRGTQEWVYFVGVSSGRSARADAYYARYLEFGTRNSPPKRFMLPAYQSSEHGARGVILGQLDKGVEKIWRR
jgi:HK97 gp10 family phage protein